MAGASQKGNCYLCGSTLTKAAFKKHALTAHCAADEDKQDCIVLKVEGAEDKNYWLYLDISAASTLNALDEFLRGIWVECCEHMSGFSFPGHHEVGKAQKMQKFSEGTVLLYEYDYGSTTELKITVMGQAQRPRQRRAVRLLGRNEPFLYSCHQCGKPADSICTECMWDGGNPFYCEDCAQEHEHANMLLPVVNSPRMGVCGYCGELDKYEFDASLFADTKR